jgi:hypothetical protein
LYITKARQYRYTDVHGLPLANSKPELRASSNPKYSYMFIVASLTHTVVPILRRNLEEF